MDLKYGKAQHSDAQSLLSLKLNIPTCTICMIFFLIMHIPHQTSVLVHRQDMVDMI